MLHYTAGIAGSASLAVLLAACGSQAAAPPRPTAVPVTATPTTVSATATPTPISVTPTPTSTRAPLARTAGVATLIPRPTLTSTSNSAVTPTAPVASSGQIVFGALQPAPGSTSGTSVAITFTVQAPSPITGVHVELDGKQVTPELGGRDERHLSAFYQPPHWSTGQHTVVATATSGGRTVTRTWSFTIR